MNQTSYTGYEYREITVPESHASLCMDSYPCFGWQPDPNKPAPAMASSFSTKGRQRQPWVTLAFRRERAIANRPELTRLQRHFDSCIGELTSLEKARRSRPAAAAWGLALAGTAFMAGSTFAAVAQPPIVWLCILLAIPGFAGWIGPYFLYQAVLRRESARIAPLMEQKYDEIHEVCEKGSRLLY